MILTCPQCRTQYITQEANFPPAGRMVRCAKCRRTWHQPGFEAATAHAPPAAASEPEGDKADRCASDQHAALLHTSPPDISPGASAAALAKSGRVLARRAILERCFLVAPLVLFAATAFFYHAQMANLWRGVTVPPSTARMRLEMPGVDLRNVSFRRETSGGLTMLVLSGTVLNSAESTMPVPKSIRVIVSDENNHKLVDAEIPSKIASLGPGESIAFRARIPDLPSANPRLHIALQD